MSTGVTSFLSRHVQRAVLAVEQAEGQGARVRRSIGGPQLRRFDPFLLLDEFRVTFPAGFPDHPHRGFQTVTYVLPTSKGSVNHEDFTGKAGRIEPGEVQWMSAGRGIVHAEVPSEDKQECHGLQLWVNLPKKDKMGPPAYQEYTKDKLPQATSTDGKISARVIAGEALGITSPTVTTVPVSYAHFEMQPHARLEHRISPDHEGFIYTLAGKIRVGGKDFLYDAHHTLALSSAEKTDTQGGESGVLIETGAEAASFVVVTGTPLGEPVAQHGPFVMNTYDEIQETFNDLNNSRNGFEKWRNWRSKLRQSIDEYYEKA